MKNPQFKTYDFFSSEHWQAGVMKNLQINDQAELIVLPEFEAVSVRRTSVGSQTSMLGIDDCDRLYWLEQKDNHLIQFVENGFLDLGRLLHSGKPVKMYIGSKRLWLLSKDEHEDCSSTISSYSIDGLQPLRKIKTNRRVLDIVGDGRDGLWWLTGGDDKPAVLHHFDRYGCKASKKIRFSSPLKRASMDTSHDNSRLVILDYEPVNDNKKIDLCEQNTSQWRLIIIDCKQSEPWIIDDIASIDEEFKPRLLTIDHQQRIHLLSPNNAVLWTLGSDDNLIAQRELHLPEGALPVNTAVSGEQITISSAMGIFKLRQVETTTNPGEERQSIFMTPTLVSPEGTPRGWQRADIAAELPSGTTLNVSYAASKDANFADSINRIINDQTVSQVQKVKQLDQRLQWQTEENVIYAGRDRNNNSAPLSFPVHQIEEPYLWLRLTFYTPPGSRPPKLRLLTVNYPNHTYLNYLPEVYAEDAVATPKIKSLLAIFEALFDELDATIHQLPDQINPETAPDLWLPFLLRWLGLPNTAGLSPEILRELVKQASWLLARRGTYQALDRLLHIICGDYDEVTIQIDDAAGGPAPWVLQAQENYSLAPRLGKTTLLVAQQPPAFQLGTTQLGTSSGVPLGIGEVDPAQVYAQQTGEIRIRISASTTVQEYIEPIIKIFLPYFLPAHCRYVLEFSTDQISQWQQRLDDGFRLMDGEHSRLGSRTIVGEFQLPLTTTNDVILDHGAYLDRGLYLN